MPRWYFLRGFKTSEGGMGEEIIGWFESPERMGDVAIGSVVFFVFVVALVRIAGKRTTAQMNNFDWIITVAIGSLASSGILLRNVSISDGMVAIAILAMCQWVTTWAVMRFEWFAKIVKAKPRLLTNRGEWLDEAMRKERVSKEEIYAKLRGEGYVRPEDANWVILETDGQLSVIPDRDIELSNVELMSTVGGCEGVLKRDSDEDRPGG